jgi:WD40 repeat protein
VAGSSRSGLVAAGDAQGTLAAWNAATGRQLGRWKVVQGPISDVVVIDDTHIAWLSWEDDAGVTIVDARNGELVRFIPAEQCEAMRVSPDGNWLAVVMHGDFMTLWNLATENPPLTLRGHRSTVADLAFDPDSSTLYSVSNDRTLISWDAATGDLKATRVAHDNRIESVAVSAEGRTIATTAERGSFIRLWNAASDQPLFDIKMPTPIRQVAFDATASYLAGLREDGIVEILHTRLEGQPSDRPSAGK